MASRPFLILAAVTTAIFAVLLVYSQTSAFMWDEGFHLLTAQLILNGKRPYLDFCFPQTPLNAFWNAAWMRIIGDTWRAAHALAAVDVAAAVLLAADFIRSRFPDPAWRLPGAIATALVFGLNIAVVEFATVGQAYGFCLLLMVCAFRVAVVATERQSTVLTAAAGMLIAAAAASTLLTAAATPVVLGWLLRHSAPGRRLRYFAAFLAGGAVPFLPVLWLFVQAPRTVFFNLFEYQLVYRRTNWEDATPHDLKVFTSWLTSPTAFLLAALAIAGLWAVRRQAAWKPSQRAEFNLAACMGAGLIVELAATHPTFESYWVLVVPFFAIPAAAGFWTLGHPSRTLPVLALALSLGLAWSLYRDRGAMVWHDLEAVAAKVTEVTPPAAPIWADEHVYFLTRRPPAEGTSFSYAEVIDIPEDRAAKLHIVADQDLADQAAAGQFQTVSTCEDEEMITRFRLKKSYLRSARVGTCTVFWQPVARRP